MTDEQALAIRPALERAVRSIQTKLPAHVEFDDLQSVAWLRVIKASQKLGSDPATLKPYLGNLVKWSIQDFGRGEDTETRDVRGKIRGGELENKLTLSLDFSFQDGDRGTLQIQDEANDAALIEHQRTLRELFRRARLGNRNSRIVRDYCLKELSADEILAKYGIGYPRLNQIVNWSLERLRAVKPRLKEAAGERLKLVCPCGAKFSTDRPRIYCTAACQGRLAVPHKPSKIPDAKELRRMYVELRMTTRDIAKAAGLVNHTHVSKALKQAGIEARPARFKGMLLGFDVEAVVRLRDQGKPYTEIVKLLGAGNVAAMKTAVCRRSQQIKKRQKV